MSTRVAELTVDQLKWLIETTVEEKLLEMFGDPDEGLELREEIKARLRRSLEAEQEGTRGIPASEVAAQLGLEW
jgi:hypothetical protein